MVKHAVERRLHLVDRGRARHKLLLHGGSWAWRRWNTETSGIGTDQACSPAGLASRSSLAASAAAFLMKSSFGRVLTCRRWRVLLGKWVFGSFAPVRPRWHPRPAYGFGPTWATLRCAGH
jgi:hypothetical protein